MLDTHDEPVSQAKLLSRILSDLRRSKKSVGITAWPTVKEHIEELKPSQGRTLAEHEIVGGGTTWFIDSGLLVTKLDFRASMPNFEDFARNAIRTYDNIWTDFEAGNDDVILDAFLFKSHLAEHTTRNAVLHPHWLQARDVCHLPIILNHSPPPLTWPQPSARGAKSCRVHRRQFQRRPTEKGILGVEQIELLDVMIGRWHTSWIAKPRRFTDSGRSVRDVVRRRRQPAAMHARAKAQRVPKELVRLPRSAD